MKVGRWVKRALCSHCGHAGRFLIPPGRLAGLLGVVLCPRCEELWDGAFLSMASSVMDG